MKRKTVQILSATVFSLIALGHLVRALMGLRVVVGGWEVPQWVSVVALGVAAGLAAMNFAAGREGRS